MATSLFRKRPLAMLTAASLLPLALLTTPAFAECERGDLAAIYCDEDGDMVADRPSDESEWVNPDTGHLLRYLAALYRSLGGSHRARCALLRGAVQRGAGRSHAQRAAAYCWVLYRPHTVCGEFGRCCAICIDGL